MRGTELTFYIDCLYEVGTNMFILQTLQIKLCKVKKTFSGSPSAC